MILVTDALTALDGALASTIALMAFTVDENDPVSQGLIGVAAGINAAKTMLEETLEQADPEPDVCPHPEDKIMIRRAGKSEVRICSLCNEFVD
jgi:hypothetical protein